MVEQSSRVTTPIRHSLPGELGQYSENEAVAYILAPWEEQSSLIYDDLIHFYERYMAPDTCKEGALDWLAQLAGFTGVYWSPEWPVYAKRALIKNAYAEIWPNFGSLSVVEWVLTEAFRYEVVIISAGNPFRFDVSRFDLDPFGAESQTIHFLLPLDYARDLEWRVIKQLLSTYIPVWVSYTLSYESFRFDKSRFGEILTT